MEGGSLKASLKTGVALCDLINIIKADTIAKIERSTTKHPAALAAAHRNNINSFLEALPSLEMGLKGNGFEVADLYDDIDMSKVVHCIEALSREFPASDPEPLADVKKVQQSAAAAAPSVRYTVISSAIIRQGSDMDSDKASPEKTIEGEMIAVLEQVELKDGTVRVRFETGWTSLAAKSGKVLLEKMSVEDTKAAEEEEAEKAAVAEAEAAKATAGGVAAAEAAGAAKVEAAETEAAAAAAAEAAVAQAEATKLAAAESSAAATAAAEANAVAQKQIENVQGDLETAKAAQEEAKARATSVQTTLEESAAAWATERDSLLAEVAQLQAVVAAGKTATAEHAAAAVVEKTAAEETERALRVDLESLVENHEKVATETADTHAKEIQVRDEAIETVRTNAVTEFQAEMTVRSVLSCYQF